MWPPPLPKLLFSNRKSLANTGQDGQNRELWRSYCTRFITKFISSPNKPGAPDWLGHSSRGSKYFIRR